MVDRRGIGLIIVIIIVIVSAIVVLGIASFVSTGLSLNIARGSKEQALYAAQAGIYAAIYDYIVDPANQYWSKAASQNLHSNIYYSVGRDANFLLVSAANSERSRGLLRGISLSNISETSPITIDKMKVEWHSFRGAELRQIQLGGVIRWNGSVPSDTTVTLASPFTLSAKQFISRLDDNVLEFDRYISDNAIIIVTFIFDPPTGDGSSRKAILFGDGKKNEFSITATGEVRGLMNWKRTVEATYDAGSSLVTSWQETEKHI